MHHTTIGTALPSIEANLAFTHAPDQWNIEKAIKLATTEGITLTEEHFQVLFDLHEYFFHHEERVNFRDLHDALDEEFHSAGGIKHLFQIFPGGPIAQGCRIAGLKVPAYAEDRNFGTVM